MTLRSATCSTPSSPHWCAIFSAGTSSPSTASRVCARRLPSPAPAASPAAPALPPTPAVASGAGDNPDDYAPAAEPAAAPSLSNRVRRATADGVPLYQDAAATAGASIPQLRLDLHVFAQRPQD